MKSDYLYAIYQRTQSESKSQLSSRCCVGWIICMQSIKEHNLKANHNLWGRAATSTPSVCNLSKNTIWKQITTQPCLLQEPFHLYAIYQRTQSESKSQRIKNAACMWTVCMQSIKEHNLKANHNSDTQSSNCSVSVCNLSKNTIWKQITTHYAHYPRVKFLYAIYQRTQSESKSQLSRSHWKCFWFCMQSIKEHNLKANHNRIINMIPESPSVCNLSKNTIWKQITTHQVDWSGFYFCMQSIKEHNLKANHNSYCLFRYNNASVCNLSKNTIWKQITTITSYHGKKYFCMQSIKEHNLKANHNYWSESW